MKILKKNLAWMLSIKNFEFTGKNFLCLDY